MPRSAPSPRPPYDDATLERAALDYAARYATTRAKLGAFLRRKLRERGWAGEVAPPIEALVERFAERGYVNDDAFAAARSESLLRRGYGPRRISHVLRAAGIDAETAGRLDARIAAGADAAALDYARRKRIGPFAAKPASDPAERRRWIASMARAGHAFDVVLRVLAIDPGEEDVDPLADPGDGGWPDSE